MNLRGSLYLGIRYVQRQWLKVAVLIAAMGLSVSLPVAVQVLVTRTESHLRSRAEATPLLLGAPGSNLELVFNALYFSKPDIATFPAGEAHQLQDEGLAGVIPVYARYAARGERIVGTTVDYFEFRGLKVAEGRMMARLGDCVLGAGLAEELGLEPGDSLVSSPEAVFDLAGVYPLKMRITGVLAASGTPDDQAVFVDVKTAWVIGGLAHGHDDVTSEDDKVLERGEDGNVALNASVREYTEITPENLTSFHFHGDPETFPLTGAIVLPRDGKARTILLGRYQDHADGRQLIEPARVMDELFLTVFQIRNVVVGSLVFVGLAVLVIMWLVFLLSNRLRAREFESLRNIGASRGTIRLLLTFETGFVIAAGLALAGLVVFSIRLTASGVIQWLMK